MQKASDLISLPYPPDLTQAGIAYACRSLAYTYDRMGGSPFARLQRIAAGKAVELAFRRYLGEQGVAFDNLGSTPFTDPDHYDIAIGRRRCDIKSYQINDKKKIHKVHRNPALLLEASALVPVDQLSSENMRDEDLYVFAFSTVLVTRQRQDLEAALAAGQPVYLIHPLPSAWAQPKRWGSLGRLALKTNLDQALRVEIGGQNQQGKFISETIHLPPQERVEAREDYYALAYLHVDQQPAGELGVFSPGLNQMQIVLPVNWGNIWVYGMRIFLAGCCTRGQFKQRAQRLPPNSQVLQYDQTRTPNMALPVRQLSPLADLFRRAKAWQA